jgi:hypothetical protein
MRSLMEEVFFFFDDRNEKRCILITIESLIYRTANFLAQIIGYPPEAELVFCRRQIRP